MKIDLESALTDLARSVHDDGVTDRMNGQVRHMVGRIRRRRAARYSATGVVGIGAVAAVAVGGLHLAARSPAPAPPAATDPTPSTTTGFGECRSAITDPNAGADPAIGLDATVSEVDVTEDTPRALVGVSFTGSTESLVTLGDVRMVVAQDGVVVGPLADLTFIYQSFPPSYSFDQRLVSCEDGAPLPDGSYEIYALQELVTDGDPGLTEVRGGPWPLTITEAPSDKAASGEASTAEEALADTLARSPVADPFPACGSGVPAQTDPPVVIDLTLGERIYAPGEAFTTEVTLRSTAGRTVLANAPTPLASIVITRDGVVVGHAFREPVDTDLIAVATDEPLTVPADAHLSVCRIGSVDYPPYDLPPGTYQAYAVAEMWLKEIQTSDDAYSLNELFAAMSNPVNITID